MSIVTNVQHYVSATLRAVGDGSLVRKATRYIHARRVDRAIEKRYGLEVKAGPFMGMRYIQIPPYRALPGKIIGFYEQELHPAIGETLKTTYDTMINVGSAEGYYAVGYARSFPNTAVYAFDIDPRQQAFCQQLAQLNHVENQVHIRGECRVEDLQQLVTSNTLIFMDCEGCEFSLLKPEVVPNLKLADIIVELHDFENGSRNRQLKAAFEATHSVTEIQFSPRHASEYPEVQFLSSEKDRELAVMDRDVESQSWFYLRSKRLVN
jgi:hypothetical protein